MAGWISRRATEGRAIGGMGGQSMKDRGPLRKIVRVIRYSTDMFTGDSVELECGHENNNAWGTKKARCKQCKTEEINGASVETNPTGRAQGR